MKLKANMEYHEKLTEHLCNVSAADENEQKAIETDIDTCTVLNMDGHEWLCSIDEMISGAAPEDSKMGLEIHLKQSEILNQEIEKLKLENEAMRKRLESEPTTMVKGSDSHEVRRKVKLPLIPLPKFSGDILKWQSFWDSFTSTIDQDETLSKVDKFNYLVGALQDEARDTVAGFTQTNEQYDLMVAHLKERYDQREDIIHAHYDKLNKITRCGNSTVDIRKTFNCIEVQLRSLESMGEALENKYLVALVKRKLPDEFNLKLEETRGDGHWTLELLRKTITKFLRARERSETGHQADDDELEYTTEGLLGKETKISCCFCEQAHWADECQAYKTVDLRKMRIRGKCYICLSTSHMINDCKSKKPCFHCKAKGAHHSASVSYTHLPLPTKA